MALLKVAHHPEFKFETPKWRAHYELKEATEDHSTAMDEGVGETKHTDTKWAWRRTNFQDPELQMTAILQEHESLVREERLAALVDGLLIAAVHDGSMDRICFL